MTRYASAAADFVAELTELAIVAAIRRRLGVHILEARIAMLERQIDDVLERAREGKCVAGKGGRR
jgi:hypothetical protein